MEVPRINRIVRLDPWDYMPRELGGGLMAVSDAILVFTLAPRNWLVR